MLKFVSICGVEFNGMMCLMCEFEFGEDYDGIIELFEDVLIGIVYLDYVGFIDLVIDVVIIFNCQDCMGVCGIVCDFVVVGFGMFMLLIVDQIVVNGVGLDVCIEDIVGCLVFFV